MTINDLELYLVEVPRTGDVRPLRSLLVHLIGEKGLSGWGEMRCHWRPSEVAERRDVLLSAVVGHRAFDIEELSLSDVLGEAGLRSAVETACWDLIGRICGQPICHFFGGVFRQHVPLAARLPLGQATSIAQMARELAELGYHNQVVTAQGDALDDLAVLAAVRESVGDRAGVCFDALGKFDSQTARELCAELEPDGVRAVVDPITDSPIDQLIALRRQTRIPLALGTGIRGPGDVLASAGAVSSIVVDPQRVGGLIAARKCAAVAEAAGVGVGLRGGESVGITLAAICQLAASVPAIAGSNETDYFQLQDDVLVESFEIIDGLVAVGTTPGLGVDVDRAKVERYQIA